MDLVGLGFVFRVQQLTELVGRWGRKGEGERGVGGEGGRRKGCGEFSSYELCIGFYRCKLCLFPPPPR